VAVVAFAAFVRSGAYTYRLVVTVAAGRRTASPVRQVEVT